SGVFVTLYAFDSVVSPDYRALDGEFPFAGVIQGTDGNLYGTTSGGGSSSLGYGTVFKISLPISPVIQSLTQTSSVVRITWSSVAGQNYKIQFKPSLLGTNWIDSDSPNGATTGIMSSSDDIGTNFQRFYRVVL